MTDILTPAQRSRVMSRIRSRDTRLEVWLRKQLFARGFRYRVHVATLPGRPDLVFPKYKAVVFIHGCFWHGHDCHLFRMPGTRTDFWRDKIRSNRERDQRTIAALREIHWRVLELWECSWRGKTRQTPHTLIDQVADWVKQGSGIKSIEGHLDQEITA
jgi:DNA mismatch endonuclease (patch repair protein)